MARFIISRESKESIPLPVPDLIEYLSPNTVILVYNRPIEYTMLSVLESLKLVQLSFDVPSISRYEDVRTQLQNLYNGISFVSNRTRITCIQDGYPIYCYPGFLDSVKLALSINITLTPNSSYSRLTVVSVDISKLSQNSNEENMIIFRNLWYPTKTNDEFVDLNPLVKGDLVSFPVLGTRSFMISIFKQLLEGKPARIPLNESFFQTKDKHEVYRSRVISLIAYLKIMQDTAYQFLDIELLSIHSISIPDREFYRNYGQTFHKIDTVLTEITKFQSLEEAIAARIETAGYLYPEMIDDKYYLFHSHKGKLVKTVDDARKEILDKIQSLTSDDQDCVTMISYADMSLEKLANLIYIKSGSTYHVYSPSSLSGMDPMFDPSNRQSIDSSTFYRLTNHLWIQNGFLDSLFTIPETPRIMDDRLNVDTSGGCVKYTLGNKCIYHGHYNPKMTGSVVKTLLHKGHLMSGFAWLVYSKTKLLPNHIRKVDCYYKEHMTEIDLFLGQFNLDIN